MSGIPGARPDFRITAPKGIERREALAGAEAQVMVTQIYLGLSQGWYISDDGRVYGYGRATAQGWRWWHGDQADEVLGRSLQPEALQAVRAMLENPAAARMIALPVTTHEG